MVLPEARKSSDGKAFEAWWKEHCGAEFVDADGQHDFYGLQRLFLRSTVIAGDCLARARFRRLEDGLPIPLQVQLLEPDHFDESQLQSRSGGKMVGGIHFDKIGRRVGYQLYREHPGDSFGISLAGVGIGQSVFVPAEYVAHGFLQERPGQVRGASWLAACLIRLYNLDGYEDSELLRQRIAACFAAFIQDADGEPDGTEEEPFELIEPGAVTKLPPGCQITFGQPPKVDGYAAFVVQQLRAVAMSMGLTYELLSGDYSKTNFSSGRMSHLSTERTIEVWRKDLIEIQLCRPFLRWALDAAMISGRQMKEVPVMWVPPRREVIDPTKEIPALILAIKAGLITWQAAVRQLGYDPDAQLESIKEIQNKMAEAGVVLETAPGSSGESAKRKKRFRKELERMIADAGDDGLSGILAGLAEKLDKLAA